MKTLESKLINWFASNLFAEPQPKENVIHDTLQIRRQKVTNSIQVATVENNDYKIMQGYYLLNLIDSKIAQRFNFN